MKAKPLSGLFLLLFSAFTFTFFASLAHAERKFEVGARIVYQKFNDSRSSEGNRLDNHVAIPSISWFYNFKKGEKIGIEFAYTTAGYSSNGIILYTRHWDFYRTGIGYKRLIFDNQNPGEPIKALVGARLDYYRSYLSYNTFDFGPRPPSFTYNNLGLAVNAEVRYSIFSFWAEYMFVRLTGGDKPDSPSVWENRDTPNLNLYGFAIGMGLVFGI